jgi:hypothetical protein
MKKNKIKKTIDYDDIIVTPTMTLYYKKKKIKKSRGITGKYKY